MAGFFIIQNTSINKKNYTTISIMQRHVAVNLFFHPK